LLDTRATQNALYRASKRPLAAAVNPLFTGATEANLTVCRVTLLATRLIPGSTC